MDSPYDNLKQLLAQHDLRLTTPRMRVFTTLHEADLPLSPREVHDRTGDIDMVSVYRTLTLFTRLGIAQIIPAGFKQKYELADIFKPHHHHLQCTQCGELINISSPELESLIESISRNYHYSDLHHRFELTGVCRACRVSREII